MNQKLGAFAALISVIVLAGCTFSLDPVNSIDTDAIANANTGLIKVTNRSGNPGVSLSAVRIIHPDETFTEYRYAPALPGYDSDLTGLTPTNSKEHRFPAGLSYRVKFHNGQGWTTNAVYISVVKGQTVEVIFKGDEPITKDVYVEKGTLTVYNNIPRTNGDYIIAEIRVSYGEAGQETEVFYYEKEINPGESKDFEDVPAARYQVRARIRKTGTETLSKWSIPALAGLADGTVPAEAGEEITVSAALAGVAVFDANVLLDDGSGNVKAPLGEVSNLTVKQGEGKLTLEWKDPDDEDVYQIEISCTDTVGKSVSQTVLKNKETAVLVGLENGEAYNIWVKTMDKGGNKSAGVEKLVMMGSDTPPAEVTNLMAAPGAGKVRLTWTDPTDPDFSHVEISYSADSGIIRTLPPVAKTVQVKTINSLNYGTNYAFTVRAVDTSGNKSMGTLVLASLAAKVTDLALDAYVTAPVENFSPDKRLIMGTQYTGTVAWLDDWVSMTASSFVQGRTYRVIVTLTANDGYTFTDLTTTDFTYVGAEITSVAEQNAGKGVIVRIQFPPAVPGWYVTDVGQSGRNGKNLGTALDTVQHALDLIKTAYTPAWPGYQTTNAQSAAIVIGGTLTESITINNAANDYPPIVLRGVSVANPGVIRASGTSPVLTLGPGAQVSMEANLTLTGGNVGTGTSGGGVKLYLASSTIRATFTMKGGIISGNNSPYRGGGVAVGPNCSFFMSGGTITGNTSERGGGVAVNPGAVLNSGAVFIMSGGTITENKASANGNGVWVTDAVFTMSGGSITHNTDSIAATSGGGVLLHGASTFTLEGGTISYNEALGLGGGGGVMVNHTSVMIMNGGTIHHNKTATSGGGVLVNAHMSPSFTMNDGTIADNEALVEGGGVSVGGVGGINGASDIPTFTIKGGSITGNITTGKGGGVYVATYGVFKKGHSDPTVASGVIFGYDPDNPNSNKVQSSIGIEDDKGHAVYTETGPKKRETTVGPDQRLDSAVPGTDGGWID
jgi:hypothetical protein